MLRMIINRLAQSLLVLLATGLVAFTLFSFAPDPTDQIVGDYATEEDRARVRAELGFDRPILIQFGDFLVKFAQGDLGKSLRTNEYVSDLIATRLPATLELVLLAAFMTLGL